MNINPKKIALIIGGGPAGLTAAYELLRKTDYLPVVIEQLSYLGGISTTIDYQGNKIDIGGHRFFSKSDLVNDWWQNFLPINADFADPEAQLSYHGQKIPIPKNSSKPQSGDNYFYIRRRLSRILFNDHFFDYPLKLSPATLSKLGFWNTIKIGFSYLKSKCFPLPEDNLESFFINRFGKELYLKFFKDYTEKVWGVSCQEISADWGAQRVKGLSLRKAIIDFLRKLWKGKNGLAKNEIESSLIEYFIYPKFGPGQLWNLVGEEIKSLGGKILFQHNFSSIAFDSENNPVIKIINNLTAEEFTLNPDYIISTAPIVELLNKISNTPSEIKEFANQLEYRDFITVGLLINKKYCQKLLDTWIYIQTPNLKTGRVQIFNNWSPDLVADHENMYWFGLEFFTTVGDDLWSKSDLEMKQLASNEIIAMKLVAEEAEIEDAVVVRVKKTYPSYIRGFKNFEKIRKYTDSLDKIFLIGRNGMHRYNNQDHSMLTAITLVDQLSKGKVDRRVLWSINTEQDYHESK